MLSIHNMGAAALSVPEMNLEDKEAKALASAIAKVADQYDEIPGMSETTAAWMNLGMVAGGIYGSRVIAYRMRVKMEKENK